MTGSIKLAAVGTGYFSQFHFDAWTRCGEVEFVGVADLNLENAERIITRYGGAAFNDVAIMLDATKPDLLDIITPPATHLPIIKMAAKRGINVICQKPFCGDLANAQRAVEIGKKSGIDITVHENFRFQPWYSAIRRELDSGRLGHIFRATFRLRPGDGQGPSAYLDRQPYFQKMERFLIHETAVHFIDVFRYLFGDLESVWADLERLNPVILGEDSCVIILKFKDGPRAVLDGNRLSDHAAENHRRTMGELLIEGEKGVLSLNGDAELSFRPHNSSDIRPIQFEWDDIGFGGDCVYHFTRHVVDHYSRGSPIMNSATEYLANLRAEEAVYESATDGSMKQLVSI